MKRAKNGIFFVIFNIFLWQKGTCNIRYYTKLSKLIQSLTPKPNSQLDVRRLWSQWFRQFELTISCNSICYKFLFCGKKMFKMAKNIFGPFHPNLLKILMCYVNSDDDIVFRVKKFSGNILWHFGKNLMLNSLIVHVEHSIHWYDSFQCKMQHILMEAFSSCA